MEQALSSKMLKSIKARFLELNFHAFLYSILPFSLALYPFFAYDIPQKGLYNFIINNVGKILACCFVGVCFAYTNPYTVKVFKNRLIIQIEEDKYNNDTWLLTTYNGCKYSLNMRECVITNKSRPWTYFFFRNTIIFSYPKANYAYKIIAEKTRMKFMLIPGFFDDSDTINLLVTRYTGL